MIRLRFPRPGLTVRPVAVIAALAAVGVVGTAAAAGPQGVGLVAAVVSHLGGSLSASGPANIDPAPAAATPAPFGGAAASMAGVTSTPTTAPRVAPLRQLIEPDLLVLDRAGLSARQRATVRSGPGVAATLPLAVGSVVIRGTSVRGVAAEPGQLRAWTPGPTARSDGLWGAVAAGELATSFDLGKNLKLPLGGPVAVRVPSGGPLRSLRLGALASLALPGLDLTVTPAVGSALRLTPDAGLLVSAPRADLTALRDQLRSTLGPAADVVLLHEVTVVRDAGEFLSRAQIAAVLQAALSRLGAPYVWGATGPDSFDCSGLVGYAFAAAGVRVPRTSEQLWLAGPHVPSDSARPGDLLFWANDPSAPADMDHVALYLGNGLMVSAPHTGDVVHVAPVYSNNFRGVVRLDPSAAARVGGSMWAIGLARTGMPAQRG